LSRFGWSKKQTIDAEKWAEKMSENIK